MKDLLNDFYIEKALKAPSDDVLNALLEAAGIDLAEAEKIRKSAKGKKKFHALLAEFIEARPQEIFAFCYRGLRATDFFQHHRRALRGLQQYVAATAERLETKSDVADYVTGLYLKQPEKVHEYLYISLFTEQSTRYHQWRKDYSEQWPTLDNNAFKKLEAELSKCFEKTYHCQNHEMRPFKHDGKYFLLFDFEDFHEERREFEAGKPVYRYRRPSLEVAFAFDPENKAVEVVADIAAMRVLMHQTCASVLYGKSDIPARPPVNEWYHLDRLLDILIAGQPIIPEHSEQSIIRKVFVDTLRLRRTQFPYWSKTLDIRCTLAKALNGERDASEEMVQMVKWDIDCRPGSKHLWRKDSVEADRATLIAVYYDAIEQKLASKPFTINRSGDGNLTHSQEDEAIKRYLRDAGILSKQQVSPPPLPSSLIPHAAKSQEEHAT